jgi:hypothetical protein
MQDGSELSNSSTKKDSLCGDSNPRADNESTTNVKDSVGTNSPKSSSPRCKQSSLEFIITRKLAIETSVDGSGGRKLPTRKRKSVTFSTPGAKSTADPPGRFLDTDPFESCSLRYPDSDGGREGESPDVSFDERAEPHGPKRATIKSPVKLTKRPSFFSPQPSPKNAIAKPFEEKESIKIVGKTATKRKEEFAAKKSAFSKWVHSSKDNETEDLVESAKKGESPSKPTAVNDNSNDFVGDEDKNSDNKDSNVEDSNDRNDKEVRRDNPNDNESFHDNALSSTQ